jgi:hypothetical protein
LGCRKLNKLGSFSMSQLGASSNGKSNPFATFMRNQRKNNDNFEESLLKLVSFLGSVLPSYIPCLLVEGLWR